MAICCPAVVWAQMPTPSMTPAQKLVLRTGEDSMSFANQGHSTTVISGYGEATYQHNANAGTGTASLARAVLFVGHRFNNKIAFFSELEVEDAKITGGKTGGTVGMEQAYLRFSLNPRQYIVAGLFVPRIGILNENHLPVNFNGVERTMVETLVIPSTWRELGVGFYGQSATLPLTYSIGLVTGLNSSLFTHGTGLQDGRTEGQSSSANNVALTAAVQYFIGDFKFQVSGYAGGTSAVNKRQADSLGIDGGAFGNPLYLGEADVQYGNNGWSVKALGTFIAIPKAGDINKAYNNNTSKQMYGAYGEIGYNLFEHTHKEKLKGQQLNLFGRAEVLDLNNKIADNGVYDGTEKQLHIIAGLTYMPIPNVCIKADVRLLHTGEQNPALVINPSPVALPYKQNNSFINVGIGYSF